MEKPVITVGIASYNRPELLRRAIQSAVSQTFRELEILISDNGSTDPRVREIVDEFAAQDDRIRPIFHPVNRGAFFNFRNVLMEASCEYFIWLADDDYWCPEYLENLLRSARRSGAALTYGRLEIVDIEVDERDRIAKEMATQSSSLAAICNFIRFDSDSVFYGIFRTNTGKKLARLLCNWRLPKTIASQNDFLEYNFVSYTFIFGLLGSGGGFCNAGSVKAVHYAGGREPFSNSPELGWRHLGLFLAYILIHVQMAIRFVCAATASGSLLGIIVSPMAALYLFLRRIGMIVSMRLRRALGRIQ